MEFNEFNSNNAPDKKTFSQKLKRLFERQGLYIVLLVCLAIIGATAYLTLRSNGKEVPEAQNPPTEQSAQAGESNDQPLNEVAMRPTASPTTLPTIAPSATPQPSARPKAKPAMMPAPLEGTVLLAFADNALLYNKTLKQWTTHNGIDLGAPEGTTVRSIAAGVVERVENDTLMGNKIVIKHADGLKSVYSNLATLPTFKAGDSVKAGQEIGKVGKSAISESEDDPHLHLELYVNDKAVDPASRISIVTELPVK